MKSRKPEAARLEADYLTRVRDSLSAASRSEVDEIIQSLQEHIEQELADVGAGEVGLVDMANVLERLGPPEAYSEEGEVPRTSPPVSASVAPAAVEPAASQTVDGVGYANLLDKVWIAYLIYVIGLYIPIIDFQFCSLIASAMLAFVLLNYSKTGQEGLRPAGTAAVVNTVLMLVMFVVSLAALAVPGVILLAAPLLMGGIACELFTFWRVFGRTAEVLHLTGKDGVAEKLHAGRIGYIVFYVVVMMISVVIGLLVGFQGGSTSAVKLWWVGLLVLPFHWVFGTLFILRPLSLARRALRERG